MLNIGHNSDLSYSSITEELLEPLDEYVNKTFPDGIVRIVRRTERGGLIRARMTGARAAVGEVLVIMDGHMEVTQGWSVYSIQYDYYINEAWIKSLFILMLLNCAFCVKISEFIKV